MSILDKTQIAGTILAGGLSRRMGGVEKSFIELAEKPLLEHCITRLSKQLDNIVINANGDAQRFCAFDLPVISDTLDGFLGPLAGVLAGLTWARDNHPDVQYIASIPSDTPFFPEDFIENSCAALNDAGNPDKSNIVLATSNGRIHPVFGLWPVALCDDLHEFLTTSETQKVLAFVDRYNLIKMPFDNVEKGAESYDPFFNINTPEDLELAKALVVLNA